MAAHPAPGTVTSPATGPDVVPWPPGTTRRYRDAGYWQDVPLGARLWEWVDRFDTHSALVDDERTLDLRSLAEAADAFAESLCDRGLDRGDRIVVQLPNRWQFVATVLGCLRAGVVPILALPAHRLHEIEYLAGHAEATMIVVPERVAGHDQRAMATAVAASLPHPCSVVTLGGELDAMLDAGVDVRARRERLDRRAPGPDDAALLLLSGGTTGKTKLIARTHNDYDYNLRRSAQVCEFDEDTRYLVALPAAHNFPLGCPGILGTLAVGGRVVLTASPKPGRAFPILAGHRVTTTAVVPAVARRWVEAVIDDPALGRDLASLHTLQIGGSVLEPWLARRIAEVLDVRLQQVFGMAEGLLNFTRPGDRDEVIHETQGRPMCPDDEVAVVDEEGSPVAPGEVGELLVRGPYTPRGYFRAPAHNRRAFTDDGWFRSGDLVRWHHSGNLVVAGRRKDLINRGGEKVSAEEIEDLLHDLLGLEPTVVVAVPDPLLGERVCAVVVGGTAPSLPRLRAAFTAHGVAAFKIPELVEPMGRLPLTAVGKVDRAAVRRAVLDRHAAGAHTAGPTTAADPRPERKVS